ncbi:MAG: MBL fold metallo-hydrolase [Spirochaetaceae bacterium]|jgi:phosphoribosyl 1,2-cyclic phosphodiesterase|nr:MBL fold metallo-hydrolase [Spirochaetaceae bacterium]
MLSLCFWGTRGSITSPGKETLEFGGNTSCLELRADDKLVIVDFGSGIRALGGSLLANDLKNGPIDADIFVTHTHLDHIIGFPLFAPLFVPTTKLRIYGPVMPEGFNVRRALKLLTDYPFWPVRIREFAAKLTFIDILETTIDLGEGLTVTSRLLNHPVITLGYRFEYQGKTIVIATDNEPFWNIFDDKSHPMYSAEADYEGRKYAETENKKLTDFFGNADIFVCDCAYTEAEYINGKQNWGHTSYESAIETAKISGVKNLVVYHHEPSRTDEALHNLETRYREDASGLKIITAKEGLVLTA